MNIFACDTEQGWTTIVINKAAVSFTLILAHKSEGISECSLITANKERQYCLAITWFHPGEPNSLLLRHDV